MQFRARFTYTVLLLAVFAMPALADKYSDAIRTFRNAG